MGNGVFSQFDTDVAAIHFVGNCCCGAGTEEGIEDEVAWIRGDVENTLDEAFWFRGQKNVPFKKSEYFFF